MLHGKGENQRFLKQSYLDDRRKALEDRNRYDDDELTELDITEHEGRGRTNYRKYQMLQWIPIDTTILKRKRIDLRERPQIGGKF